MTDLREALVAADSILSLLRYRGIIDSEYNREDVRNAQEKVRRAHESLDSGAKNPATVETKVVPFPDGGSPAVLLQLDFGYVVIRPEDARRVAQQLIDTAAEADARQN